MVAFAPDSLTGLFSDMDESQWARFISVMEQQVCALTVHAAMCLCCCLTAANAHAL